MICTMLLLLLIAVFYGYTVNGAFSPDTSDYDAYGVKIAANDVVFVEAQGSSQTFLVQFAPYNYMMESLQCSIDYDDDTHYVYSVNVGVKQSSSTNVYFFIAGEVLIEDSSGHNGTFVGVWVNQDPQSVQDYVNSRQPFSCDYFEADNFEYISSYGHQEYFVLAVEPYGQYAIGLAASFAFIYRPFPSSAITTKPGTLVWPANSTFSPCAADAQQLFTVVAGFVPSSARSRVRATPTVYLLWNSNLTVLASWSYTATSGSWQSRLTYAGVDTWSSKYSMSVKINSNDSTRVLVGMPFLNTVFLFAVTNNGTNLVLESSVDNGNSVGFGKSVTWLTNSQAAVLVSTYSLDYSTWYSSQIYLYTSLSNTTVPSSPTAVVPNAQQPVPSTISAQLIQIVSTPESLGILDVNGGVLLLLAAPPGYYSSTDMIDSSMVASMPVVSYFSTCIGGTYKIDTGVHPCTLCPIGSRNLGNNTPGTSCTNCSPNKFCPLGSVYEIDPVVLVTQSQAYAYPRSPDLAVYEDILITNMFSMGSTAHCLVVSPLFWTMMVTVLAIVLVLGMATLHWFIHPEKSDRWRTTIKNIFQRTDLVGEGELWVGGLASIAIVLVTIMAYVFAISYLNQYPAEKTNPSSFACDTTIRNAQFQSSLQALAVPISDEEQPMFDLLNEQNFTFHLDFINTAVTCMEISVSQVVGSSLMNLPLSSCSNSNGTLSITIILPEHDITVVTTLNDIQLVGALRVGLSGLAGQNGLHTLKELNFYRAFYSPSNGTLAQTATINMQLTKAINETEPLASGDSEFTGLWYPTFVYDMNQMFLTANNYVKAANLTSTTLTIYISETSYYIQNIQSAIAKESEIMFRTLLFAFLCLEISGLIFLIIKLLIIPLYKKMVQYYYLRTNRVQPIEKIMLPHH